MRKIIYQKCIELTNRAWLSNLIRQFTRSKISKIIIPFFVKIYKIDMSEFEYPYNEYTTLHELFIRKLKKGTRLIDSNINTVISPVDATIESIGSIEPSTDIKVKGKMYSLKEMLGNDEKAVQYRDGYFIVLYLSPKHYHRIHSPVNGKVISRWELGDRSYPVNRLGLEYGKNPLAKNYRSISEINHKTGKMALVKVGAMFVNSIEYTNGSMNLKKGEEIAYFSFGSTVVLLFEKDTFLIDERISVPHPVKMGEVIGHLVKK
ncbi:phosphatidylserine decarboxylase [Caldibacillus sp. 210928-DFI.2.22]|uniref:phosphatidylserine decarboxylase n=1 Tax=Bacillaceae TaxID=186817 RepID=UPI001D088F57|nr:MULTISPECIES: phosphatidylserine decarboxylase [unclassified Caldibacillus]MCB7068917.1 phosphatidylserine decarboxylase [Caldibacillus sp. 210928-DFI.2.22]MCB7073153.1 phosphatidylserine decarboxylase [Caldibacillus sp. 210928-DFI.2.18]